MPIVEDSIGGRLGSAVFLVIGVVALAVTAMIGINRWDYVQHAARAPGVVVKLAFGPSHPEIEFTDAAGEKVSYVQGGWVSGLKVGDAVTVLYRPTAPAGTASIDGPGALWFGPVIPGLVGLAFVARGILGLRRRQPSPA